MNSTSYLDEMQSAFDELFELYEQQSTCKVPLTEHGDFEFAANAIFELEAEHFRAAKTLLQAKRFIPARILGRVMFEGMVLLLWINADCQLRARRWRGWAAVTDWRLLREKESAGLPVSQEQRERVLKRADEVRPLFQRKNPEPEEPFMRDWRPTLPEMLRQLPLTAAKLKDLYYPVYQLDSQLLHWNVGGVGPLLERTRECFDFHTGRQRDQVIAMNSVFHAAWHILFNLGRWFGKELDERLETIAEHYTNNGRHLLEAR